MAHKRSSLLIASLAALILCGCSAQEKAQSPGLRIISCAPSITEILYALGLDKEVVGVSQHCNYPPGVASKVKIGTFSRPNIEKIIDLRPDIIFLTGLEQDAVASQIKSLGSKTVTIYPKGVEDLYRDIKKIGALTGTGGAADSLVNNMKQRIESVRQKVLVLPADSRKRILFEIMDDPLIVAGKDSFVGQLGTIAGGVNIAYDTDRDYTRFSPELIIKRNPDCIILGYMFKAKGVVKKIQKRLGWSGINAVKAGAIFNDINPDILLRPGPRAPQAIEEIYKRLYEG